MYCNQKLKLDAPGLSESRIPFGSAQIAMLNWSFKNTLQTDVHENGIQCFLSWWLYLFLLYFDRSISDVDNKKEFVKLCLSESVVDNLSKGIPLHVPCLKCCCYKSQTWFLFLYTVPTHLFTVDLAAFSGMNVPIPDVYNKFIVFTSLSASQSWWELIKWTLLCIEGLTMC